MTKKLLMFLYMGMTLQFLPALSMDEGASGPDTWQVPCGRQGHHAEVYVMFEDGREKLYTEFYDNTGLCYGYDVYTQGDYSISSLCNNSSSLASKLKQSFDKPYSEVDQQPGYFPIANRSEAVAGAEKHALIFCDAMARDEAKEAELASLAIPATFKYHRNIRSNQKNYLVLRAGDKFWVRYYAGSEVLYQKEFTNVPAEGEISKAFYDDAESPVQAAIAAFKVVRQTTGQDMDASQPLPPTVGNDVPLVPVNSQAWTMASALKYLVPLASAVSLGALVYYKWYKKKGNEIKRNITQWFKKWIQ